MTTECSQEPFAFHPLNQREVRGQFDGGSITSDAGGLLLREVEKRTNIVGQFASCFTDYRDAELREHAVTELVAGNWGPPPQPPTTLQKCGVDVPRIPLVWLSPDLKLPKNKTGVRLFRVIGRPGSPLPELLD